MKFLVTGSAGFIGYHVTKKLLSIGHDVIGLDNLNEYYDVSLKEVRLNLLKLDHHFAFYKCDLTDTEIIKHIFMSEKFDRVIHLGGQSGVRHSVKQPMTYAVSNVIGYLNILEECRSHKINHLIYASSSSVYGLNQKLPFSVLDPVDRPASLYAVTKRTNELMAYTYSYLYKLPTTGLRLFTVYGPWGRPDMVLFRFTQSIISGKTINIYNYGKIRRAFTFIDDVVEVIIRLQDKVPSNQDGFHETNSNKLHLTNNDCYIPYRIFNVANNKSIELMDCIHILEKILGVKAKKNFLSMQLGDIESTACEDVDFLNQVIGFTPETSIVYGIQEFVNWFKDYYQL